LPWDGLKEDVPHRDARIGQAPFVIQMQADDIGPHGPKSVRPPKTEVRRGRAQVCFGPLADITLLADQQ
jgi:hypothetical protein